MPRACITRLLKAPCGLGRKLGRAQERHHENLEVLSEVSDYRSKVELTIDHPKHRASTHPPESRAWRRDVGASGLDKALSLHHAANARAGSAGDLHDPSDRRKVNNPCVLIDSIVNGESREGYKLTPVWS